MYKPAYDNKASTVFASSQNKWGQEIINVI